MIDEVIYFIQRQDIYALLSLDISSNGKIYALLTKHEVKMTGYWPSSFFALLWIETKSRFIKTQKKKRTRPINSHLDRTGLVNKGLHQRISLLREKREIPSGQDRPILPARVANQNTGFALSCPLAEPAI